MEVDSSKILQNKALNQNIKIFFNLLLIFDINLLFFIFKEKEKESLRAFTPVSCLIAFARKLI